MKLIPLGGNFTKCIITKFLRKTFNASVTSRVSVYAVRLARTINR